jgi:hypothetical protein
MLFDGTILDCDPSVANLCFTNVHNLDNNDQQSHAPFSVEVTGALRIAFLHVQCMTDTRFVLRKVLLPYIRNQIKLTSSSL